MMANNAVLEKKLQALAGFPTLNPQSVTRFGEIIANLKAWDLWRINPLQFAAQYNLNPFETVCLFLHATKVGLFDFGWNLICPMCGRVEYSYESINYVDNNDFWCSVCQIDVKSNLDDHIEVSFTLNPSVQKLELDPYISPAHFRRYFFTQSIGFTAEQARALEKCIIGIQAVPPDGEGLFEFDAQTDKPYQITNITLHKTLNIKIDPTATPQQNPEEIDMLPNGFAPQSITLPLGKVAVRLRNHLQQPMDLLYIGKDPRNIKSLYDNPPRKLPMLTGKNLLNNQDFRHLYRTQQLRNDLKLNIRSLTVLFTDLKGSTELYDRMGDAFAYNLIQAHFRILTQAVRNHAGAIVKTMGDAIMATFSSPQEGIRATLEMVQGMQALNDDLDEHELGLKVGLHEGTVLAVNADERLDYFGQTVNIAARVQALAKAGEIWLTRPVFEANQVTGMLREQGYQHEEHSVYLKGVSDATTVYRLYS